jgi:hypothetical protein
MNSVRLSRIAKAQRFMTARAAYMVDVIRSVENQLVHIKKAAKKSKRKAKRLCVRMNGSSDIAFEGIACTRNGKPFRNVFEAFPEVDFVDYTKNPRRFDRVLPANYHLVFSRSETNEAIALQLLERGVNVAAVFADKPVSWKGFIVIDGDQHDLRQLDPRGPRGFVIGLSPKGRKAKRDQSGFVIR